MNTSTTPQDSHEADILTVDFEGRMLTVSQTTSGKVQ